MRKLNSLLKKWPLAVKFSAAMTIIIGTVVISVTLLSIRREQQTFRAELEQQADLLLTTLAAAAADPLYTLDADALTDMVEALGVQAIGTDRQILASGRVYGATGRIIADAYDPLLMFGLEPDPFGQRLLESGTTVFDWRPDQLVAGRPVIVGAQQLGAVSVGLPTAPLEAKLAAVRNQGLIVAGMTLVIGIVVALLLSRSITRPLQELVTSTKRIAEGDLTQKVPRLNGELGTLGNALDYMRGKLRELHQGLEQQVAERTAELTKTNEYLLQAIVEREQTEEALAQALAQAQAANRLKSQLLARVSHELRTPLNAILGYAEMLELGAYGDISDRQRQAVSKIVSSNNSLTSLVNELLDLASLEAGKLVLTMTSFTPVDIVDPVLARLNVLAQRKGLSLTSQIAADTPRILFGDPNRVQQILTNLVGNAIKFTETGSVEVSLYRPDARYWAMQVSDTGPGIPPEAQQYIFEPFRQVDGSMTRLHKGSGLGLSIVKELTTLIGGQVMVESEPGRGSAFTVLLPLHPVQETPNNGPVERIATDGMEGLTKEF